MPRVLPVVAALVSALLLAAAAHAQNPQFKANPGSADPEIAFFGGTYYLTSTRSNRIRTSTDLRTWRESGRRMFTKKGAPRWSRDTKVYGPKIYFSDALGKYVLFFNAIHKAKGRHCIGRAVAKGDEPYDFVNAGRETFNPNSSVQRGPFECEDGKGGLSPSQYSLIDQSIFQDPKNPQNAYLLYKRDFPRASGRTKDIVIRPISPDLTRLGPKPKPILTAEAGTWEDTPSQGAPSVEAPKMIYRAATDRYYVFYSGSSFTRDTYAVGVAASLKGAANGPMGTFKKFGRNPILRGIGDEAFCGVGSQEVLDFGGDRWGIFYHAYRGGGDICAPKPRDPKKPKKRRYLMADALNWNQRGGNPAVDNFWPSVNDGTPSGEGNFVGKLQPAPRR